MGSRLPARDNAYNHHHFCNLSSPGIKNYFMYNLEYHSRVRVFQISFLLISLKIGPQIFELCNDVKKDHPWRNCFHKILCFVFGPVMPIFLVGNYTFLKKQEVLLKRSLQKNNYHVEESQPLNPDHDKMKLFKQIQHVRFRAALNRKVYYYFRIVHASIESFIGKLSKSKEVLYFR